MLALHAQMINPQATPVPPKPLAELQELVLARQSLIAGRTALANRLAAAESSVLKRLLKRQLALAERQLLELEKAIAALIATEQRLKRRCEILTSIKGIGPVTAAAASPNWACSAAAKSRCSPASPQSIAIAVTCACTSGDRAG